MANDPEHVPLAALPNVTSGEVCHVVAAESSEVADFSTIHGHHFKILSSFTLNEADLRSAWEKLLSCRVSAPFKPKKCRAELAIRLYSGDVCVGAAEVKWANNTILVLINDYFSMPIFDANAPDAIAIRRGFEERLF